MPMPITGWPPGYVRASYPASFAVVAFGALSSVGLTPAFSVTGKGAVHLWGHWRAPLLLTIERSTNAGVTWARSIGCGAQASDTDTESQVFALGEGALSGAALYRLRLDSPFLGGAVNWCVIQ